jgi:phosphatidylinositol-3-phosphatase
MPRHLPRWLFVLIGLIIIVVVGSVVLFSMRVMEQTAVNTTVTTTPNQALATANALTATAQANLTNPALTHSPPTATSTKTVLLILMENHNLSDIKNSPSAPYINGTLLPMASYAQQYFNPPGNHPSEPNYLWLEAGTNFGISDDANPDVNHQGTTQHLVTLLNNAHVSWKSYQEGISGTVCPLTGNGLYAPKHNPMVFFDDVTNTNNPNASYCIAHVRPYTELATDLQQNTQARYNFITPNLCNDMHDTCAPLNDSVKQGDSWLAQNLPTILNSQAYKKGGIVFITWDEGEGGDGPIGMIVLSHDAKGGGYSNTIRYTHSSTLRTLEEIFGVSPLLGDAAHATDLRDLFKTFP